jgi:hypothetical protein
MIRKGDWKYIHFSWYGNLLFNIKSDPGEFNNLAGKPESRAVEDELHAALTSLLDPEAVTRRGFDEHDKRLNAFIREMPAEQFYQMLLSRLGPGQARSITYRHYKA